MYFLSISEARALHATSASSPDNEEKPDVPTLMQHMRDTGLVMKPGALPLSAPSFEEKEPANISEMDLISQLTKKQKKKLLK